MVRTRRRLGGATSTAVVAVAGAILLAALVAFAVILINQQHGDRQDIKNNFRDRAVVSAALTQSLFEASGTAGAAEATRRYGTRTVSPQTLAAAQRQGQSTYMALLDSDGKLIAASPGAPPAALKRLASNPPDVAEVAHGAPYGLSNFLNFGQLKTFEYASPVNTDFGKRVIVSGVSPQLLAVFLSGYLKKVPSVGNGAAYLLDGNNVSIAATTSGAAPGSLPQTPGLVSALASGRGQGSFGDGRYFVSAPLEGSPWKVVSTAPQSTLFASVSGAHKWIPWLIFGLFAVAGAFALVFLGRVLRSADEIADVNDRLEDANEALERRARELARSNSELEQFASIASHDLKEPLRKVQTFTEQLARSESDRLSEQGRDYLERTTAAGERMQNLIDDLLRFSRVATQGRPFEEVDLAATADQAVSDLEAVIQESLGSVEVGEMPTVMADPVQMRQLIQNLISNALKFRREGVPPRVRIAGSVDGRLAQFQVSDNGIGFDPRYATRIFKVFERLHGRGTYGGTGIGLALCRKIVDRHGGTITAESTPGEGSTFTVTLPVKQADSVNGAGTNGDRSVRSEAVHA
jgi:signal transduction histidine kinase